MKNKTKFDLNIHKQLFKVLFKKSKLFIIISSVFLIIIGIPLYLHDDSFGLFSIVLGISFIIIFGFFFEKIQLKQLLNNSLLKDETYSTYDFNEAGFTVTTTRNGSQYAVSNHNYTDILRVIENNVYLFLFISKAQAFVIFKENMIEGSIFDLIGLLKSKVNKYKVVK